MAFRKQLPQLPAPTVREMVTKHGDQWYLFCASHPISNAVWMGDMRSGERHEYTLMNMFETGKRDRIDPWDVRETYDRLPVHVEHVFPPIPERCCDYAAYRDPDPGNLVGRGSTPFEAINDLIEQESEQ